MPVKKKDENNNDNTENTDSTTTIDSSGFRTKTRGTRQRRMSLTIMVINQFWNIIKKKIKYSKIICISSMPTYKKYLMH